jgi:ribose transport system substrate-binding protein
MRQFCAGVAVLAVSACLLALVSCGGGGAAPVEKKVRLAFVTNNASDFWTIARAGCEAAVKELKNVELDFKIPGDGTAASQKRILDDLLVAGEDGIAISPVDPANQTAMLNEAAAKTLVITHDSDAPASNRSFYVGTDNVAAGREAGALIKQALPDGGKIMVFVGTLDAQNAKERYQGIQEALKDSKVQIIDVRQDRTDRVRAKANVLDTLVQYPDVACLVGLWSYNGPAIVNAVKEQNRVGNVKIVCFDEEDDTLTAVKSGAIFATVVQQPYQFGYQAITMMAKVVRGDKTAIPAGKLAIVPTLRIQKENVDEFWAKLKTLRGR